MRRGGESPTPQELHGDVLGGCAVWRPCRGRTLSAPAPCRGFALRLWGEVAHVGHFPHRPSPIGHNPIACRIRLQCQSAQPCYGCRSVPNGTPAVIGIRGGGRGITCQRGTRGAAQPRQRGREQAHSNRVPFPGRHLANHSRLSTPPHLPIRRSLTCAHVSSHGPRGSSEIRHMCTLEGEGGQGLPHH